MPFQTSILYIVSCIKKNTEYRILNTKYRKSAGFTLVELLIGIALIAGISVFIFQIYLSHFKIFSGQSLAIAVASENQIAMDEITNTARQALLAQFTCWELHCKVGGINPTQYFNPDSQSTHLSLNLWPLDTSGSPIDPASTSNPSTCVGDYISYYLGDNPKTPTADSDGYYHLTRETAQYSNTSVDCQSSRQHGKKVIASKIKSINFAYTPNSTGTATEVKITITNEGNALFKPFKPYTYTRTSLARLKNREKTQPISIPPVVVSTGNNDAKESDADTAFDRGSNTITMNSAPASSPSSRTNGGFRFQNIPIPQGAIINSATLRLWVDPSGDNRDNANVDINAEAVDNALDFLANPDVTSRGPRTASVPWVQNNLGQGFKTSPDISSVIQEVINRGGWASGYSLVVFVDGQQTLTSQQFSAFSFEGDNSQAAQLNITYTPN